MAERQSIEVLVPTLPESVSDAVLVSWHKKVGDVVRREENLVDIETDKVVLEMPAPRDGVLREVFKGDGERVGSRERIAVIELGEVPAALPVDAPTGRPPDTPAPAPPPPPSRERSSLAALSPAVRRLVSEHGIDSEAVRGTGKGGRITKADVLEYLAAREPPAPAASQIDEQESGERRVPMSRLRLRIAERMVQAQRSAAILTSFNEINLDRVMELRRRYREEFEERHGVRLGYMGFFVKACVEALRRFPVVNASVDGEDILYHDECHVGIAVASKRGLLVPVVRDAQNLSLADIERTIAELAEKARSATLDLEALSGGTFTITNGGVFGSLLSTPIVNPPQSAILGMHKIEPRPIVQDGEIIVASMMYVALSYDHRIVDGAEAVQFLVAIKEALEDPGRMLLQV